PPACPPVAQCRADRAQTVARVRLRDRGLYADSRTMAGLREQATARIRPELALRTGHRARAGQTATRYPRHSQGHSAAAEQKRLSRAGPAPCLLLRPFGVRVNASTTCLTGQTPTTVGQASVSLHNPGGFERK